MSRPSARRLEQVFTALALHPQGVTVKHLARKLGWKETATSQALHWLWIDDRIARRRIVNSDDPHTTQYLYTIKPVAIASPPTQWKPETRLAGSMIREDAAAN